MTLKDKNLALFFTRALSLKIWADVGMLEREIALYNLLAEKFNKIYFFTYGDKTELKYKKYLADNIEIIYKKSKLPNSIYQLVMSFKFKKILKDCDFLKTNQMDGAIAATLAKWLYKKKLIARCGYEWLYFLERQRANFWKRIIAFLLEKIVYHAANKIILSSEKDKKFIQKRFEIPSLKITNIPNYINTDLFRPLNIPKKNNRIIFIGRLERQKNLFNLLKAISGLNLKLVIFGGGSLKRILDDTARKMRAKIEFRGNILNSQLPQELNKSKIFILPSFYEGCPKVLLEAMACGLPVIGANVGGIKEIINHKENGYLCETDSESIKKAVIEVLWDKDLQKKIGTNARRTILQDFSLEKNLRKEIEIYKTI